MCLSKVFIKNYHCFYNSLNDKDGVISEKKVAFCIYILWTSSIIPSYYCMSKTCNRISISGTNIAIIGNALNLTTFMLLALDLFSNNYITILHSNFTKFRLPKPMHVSEDKSTAPANGTKELNQKDTVAHNRPKNVIDYEKANEDFCKNSWQEDYTKLHQHLIETNQKFLIHKCNRIGWGNRVKGLMVYFHFAVVTKRAYIIDCNSPSPLDKYLSPRNIKWNYKVKFANLTVRREKIFIADNILKISNSDTNQFERLLNYSVELNPRIVGKNASWHTRVVPLKYDLPVWPDLEQMGGCSFHYLFRKSDYLQRRLDEWKKELGFNENIVLGIHIREGDMVFNFGGIRKRFSNLEKDIDFTFTCAEQIQKVIEKKYNTDKVIWFLAADSEKRKATVEKKYGSKVRFISGPIEHVAHATRGNEDAGHLSMFLDFFLLRESDFRLYSSPSTFPNAVDRISLGSTNSGRSLDGGRHRCRMPQSLMNSSGASTGSTT